MLNSYYWLPDITAVFTLLEELGGSVVLFLFWLSKTFER